MTVHIVHSSTARGTYKKEHSSSSVHNVLEKVEHHGLPNKFIVFLTKYSSIGDQQPTLLGYQSGAANEADPS